MVYCSPDKLLEHINARNQLGDESERRSIKLPYDIYSKMFRVLEQPEGFVVDTLDKDAVTKVMNDACEAARQSSKASGVEMKDFSASFLQTFKLNTCQTVKIVPFCDCDLMVNTGTETAAECAQQIIDQLNQSTLSS